MLFATLPVVLSVPVACAGFVLSRFSDTNVKLLTKAVPLGLIGVIGAYAALRVAFSNENPVFKLLGQSLLAPELWICVVALVVGITVAAIVVAREKCVDVT